MDKLVYILIGFTVAFAAYGALCFGLVANTLYHQEPVGGEAIINALLMGKFFIIAAAAFCSLAMRLSR